MHIVMICDGFFRGLTYQENMLARLYTERGHRVTVITSTLESIHDLYQDRYDRTIEPTVEDHGLLKVHRLRFALNILHRVRSFRGVYRLLEEANPDLIFVHDIHFNLHDAARYRRRHPGCRLIMDYHADFSNSAKNWISLLILHKLIRRTYLRWNLDAIDTIYAVVPTCAEFLSEVYGIPREEVAILPLGTDLELSNRIATSGARERIRRSLDLPRDGILVFTGGRLTPAKATEQLIDAVSDIADPRLHLIVVGEVRGPSAYESLIEAKCASNPRVTLTGWVDSTAVYEHMAAADVAVFTGTQSVLWQQAMGMGLGLVVPRYVTTDEGREFEQTIEHLDRLNNVIQLQARGDKSSEIRTVLERFLDQPEEVVAMGARARGVAHEHLGYDQVVAETLGGLHTRD